MTQTNVAAPDRSAVGALVSSACIGRCGADPLTIQLTRATTLQVTFAAPSQESHGNPDQVRALEIAFGQGSALKAKGWRTLADNLEHGGP